MKNISIVLHEKYTLFVCKLQLINNIKLSKENILLKYHFILVAMSSKLCHIFSFSRSQSTK